MCCDADRGFKAQGLDRKKLIYHSKLQPWLSYYGVFWITIFILINGFSVFWDFNASDFLTACTCPVSRVASRSGIHWLPCG